MVFLVVQYDTCWQQCVLTVFAMSVVWFLQVSLWRQAQRNGLHLCPYAQELAADAGDGNTGCVEQPPGEGMWEGAVVHPAGEQVEEMYCAREVQALLCPLHKVPEAHRPKERIYYVGSYDASSPYVFNMHCLIGEELVERQRLPCDYVKKADTKAETDIIHALKR